MWWATGKVGFPSYGDEILTKVFCLQFWISFNDTTTWFICLLIQSLEAIKIWITARDSEHNDQTNTQAGVVPNKIEKFSRLKLLYRKNAFLKRKF